MTDYTDERGQIKDLDEGIQFISCTGKGVIRANHYHKTSSHRSILTTGSLYYYELPVGNEGKPTKKLIAAPAIFDTGPMVWHTMSFLEPSTFVCLRVGGSKNQQEYEDDLVRGLNLEEVYNNYISS